MNFFSQQLDDLVSRLRQLLDIYSERWLQRVIVLGLFAAGAVMLANKSYSGALPFLLLAWANHRRFFATVIGLLDRRPALVVGVPLFVIFAKCLIDPPAAADDLLRHIAVNFWPNGYRDMYAHTSLPPAELYPAFDRFVGMLARSFGMAPAMWIMQALAAAIFLAAFIGAARKILKDRADWSYWVLLILLPVLTVMMLRLFLARPEIFMTAWAIAALLPAGPVAIGAWVLGGLALGSGYWLAPIYFPAVVLLPLSWRARILLFLGLSVAWLLMWAVLAQGQLVSTLLWAFQAVASREPGLGVSENQSILGVLFSLPMLMLLAGAFWAARRGGDTRLLWLAGFFALSNQARYGTVIAPLLALCFLGAAAGLRFTWAPWQRGLAVVLGLSVASALADSEEVVPKYAMLPGFDLPEGAVVLTGFTAATYSTLFFNPGAVRISPAFEIGASEKGVQQLVVGMARGKVDCAAAMRYGFTHVIENTLAGNPPDCLRLTQTLRDYRLWTVVGANGSDTAATSGSVR